EADSRVDEHTLELVDLAVGPSPFLGSRKAFDALYQHAAIPGPVKRDDLRFLRQAAPEALEVVLGAFVLVRRGDRVDLETAWIKRPAKAANDAALAGGIPSLDHEKCPLRRSDICLLDELKHTLQRRQ